ncbi:baseplate J/gp47 family protein [Acinetobacter sp. YH01020]|uniref:baseplate J/gp47 family protein n=1 Tax=Acinetobacter sp. YH01020 TaxID=2601034 RepID=UPI0015D44FFA|nr:baseplate J/gp47 family protein [Acinetobacter sp. YH01020]
MAGINFDYLAPPKLIQELDFEKILAERKEYFLSLYSDEKERAKMAKTISRESEPVTKLLQESAYRELIFRQQRNEDVKALLVMYSSGTDLDHLVADRGVQRLTITPADNRVMPPIAEVKESDDDLRYRYILAMDGLSVAGPISAYKYFAHSADGRVGDVSVISPPETPYYLDIFILQNDSETGAASKELIDIVQIALNDDEVRPVCDRPIVKSVSIVEFNIVATLYAPLTANNSVLLQQASANIDAYVKEQRRIGRSIRLSALYSVLHVAGIEHVKIDSPAQDIILDQSQAGHCTSVKIKMEAYE